MQIFHCETFSLSLPAGHRFPASKYQRLHQRICDWRDPQLNIQPAPAVARDILNRHHCPDYVERVFEGQLSARELRELGFPWSPQLVERSCRSVGATLAASAAARAEGVAVSLAGGTHHAALDRGAGFCVFNDVVVTAAQALRESPASRVLIVDCDVHQGDGTARMLDSEPRAYTFSIHSARNYPHRKAASDLDIGLPDHSDDSTYLKALERGLDHAFRVAQPDLALYIAGADVFVGDRLGRLDLSAAGIRTRDQLVLDRARQHQAAMVVVMGGGYAPDIDDIVDIHAATVRCAATSFCERKTQC